LKLINDKLTAKTLFGFEELLANELKALGAVNVELNKRAVTFSYDKGLMYKCNYQSRLAIRILKPVFSFTATDPEELYKGILEWPWDKEIAYGNTFSLDSVVHSPHFDHSHFALLKVKDAIVDKIRNVRGNRPNISQDQPDLRINLRIDRDEVTISFDSSSDSLHKRGYRASGGPATLSEVLGAGLVQLSGWNKEDAFLDPMCGTGTMPIEAALYALDIPAGYFRRTFGFEKWADYDIDLFTQVKKIAHSNIKKECAPIFASDKDMRSIQTSKRNMQSAGVLQHIELKKSNFIDSIAPFDGGHMLINPPYDEKLRVEDIEDFYSQIGDTLKQSYSGWNAWILSGSVPALKRIGLRASKKLHLYNGPMEVRLHKFELYKGTRKIK